MRNAMGVEIKRGYYVEGEDAMGRAVSGVIVRTIRTRPYVQFELDTGDQIEANMVRQTLGPMKIGKGGIVKQNPLTRVRINSPSQLTGDPPSEKLKKRRRKTSRQPEPGLYANPLVRVKVKSASQRTGEAPSTRLMDRRKVTKNAPKGFYANPTHHPGPRGDVWFVVSGLKPKAKYFHRIATFDSKTEAVIYARALHAARPNWQIKVDSEA